MNILTARSRVSGDASSLLEQLWSEIERVTAHYKKLAADGVSLSDGFELLAQAIASFMRLAEAAGTYSGPDKKAIVVLAAEKFYEEVLRPLDLPGVPNFLEVTVVDPLLGRMVSPLVGGLVDALAAIFNRVGWFDSAPAAPPPNTDFEPY